jgi:transposase
MVRKAQINKTDRNDARGIAQMMRVGLYRPVHASWQGESSRRRLGRCSHVFGLT